jgi:transcriptional regulator with XRE-family HTH domain
MAVDDGGIGRAIRAVRVRARLRQVDIAMSSGVARTAIIEIEAGRLGHVRIDDLRAVAQRLDMTLDLGVRWQGADQERLVAAGHARMHELVATMFRALPGWEVVPEVSFSVFGERGLIDLVAWHEASRSLLIIELKTALGDPQQLVATMDRRLRLAARIVAERGWRPATVSAWVVLPETRTNRRRVAAHHGLLRARLPAGGRELRAWLRSPVGAVMCLSFLTDVAVGDRMTRTVTPRRVRRARSETIQRDAR